MIPAPEPPIQRLRRHLVTKLRMHRSPVRQHLAIGTLAAWLCAAGSAAVANVVKSLYTSVDLAECTRVAEHPDGDAWRCEGLPGYPVYVAEGDHRQFVSVGLDAEARRAAKQTPGAFNSIFSAPHSRATIEWRFVRRDGDVVPYAIIVRFHTHAGERRGDVLVVMKVSSTETCHVAMIDALANPEPLILARNIADEEARKFNCRSSPRARGATGQSPM